jgi:hypothetical protein
MGPRSLSLLPVLGAVLGISIRIAHGPSPGGCQFVMKLPIISCLLRRDGERRVGLE